MNQFDNKTYRVGRCNNSDRHFGNRPAYAWRTDSGLRLEDVTCPKCGGMLDRTSREAHGIHEIPEADLDAMRETRIEKVQTSARQAREWGDLWRADEAKAVERGDGDDAYRCSLQVIRSEESVVYYGKALRRLRKAAAKAVA